MNFLSDIYETFLTQYHDDDDNDDDDDDDPWKTLQKIRFLLFTKCISICCASQKNKVIIEFTTNTIP
jgi:hypothetical protein